MPKKFAGENSKSADARARKADAKNEERAKVQKAKEDAEWADDDKHVLKKQQRKEEQEKKRLEALAKKEEKSKLYEEEMSSLTAKPVSAPKKITKAEIEAQKRKEQELKKQQEEEKLRLAQNIEVMPDDLPENINKLVIEGETARDVEEAISILGTETSAIEKHPEKRMRAAYAAFEERRLAELKVEKPTLRLSQLKQLLKKEWLKSPENPLLNL